MRYHPKFLPLSEYFLTGRDCWFLGALHAFENGDEDRMWRHLLVTAGFETGDLLWACM